MHVLKIGSLYIGRSGSLTDRQSDALRVDLDSLDGIDRTVRPVRLRPHGTAPTSSVDSSSGSPASTF